MGTLANLRRFGLRKLTVFDAGLWLHHSECRRVASVFAERFFLEKSLARREGGEVASVC